MTSWRPRTWRRRMKPSSMKLDGDEDVRCARCGRWPDQDTAVGGDWLWFTFDADGNPVRRLCPGCHERVMHAIECSADWRPLDDIIIEMAQRWPERGRLHDGATLASSIGMCEVVSVVHKLDAEGSQELVQLTISMFDN